MKYKKWIKAAGIRALKTWAQAAIGAIGTLTALSDVHWGIVVSTATLSALVSLLTSITGLPELDKED